MLLPLSLQQQQKGAGDPRSLYQVPTGITVDVEGSKEPQVKSDRKLIFF